MKFPKIVSEGPKPFEVYIEPICYKCKYKINYNEAFTAIRILKHQTNFYCNDCRPFTYDKDKD